jgi:PAS domain S-box-containing protein
MVFHLTGWSVQEREPPGEPKNSHVVDRQPSPEELSVLEQRLHALQLELDSLRRSETRLTRNVAVEAQRGAHSQELFRLLVESVRDYAIFMLDPTGHVATWNIGARRIKGYTESEIVGRHFSSFYPEEDVRSGKCEFELEVAAQDGRFEDEGWRVRKDGSRFWANVVISSVRDSSGTLVGFAKVTRDLTERKKAEEERAARRAAEEANRAKDEFLAMLGHELRNPLAPIAAALQLMQLRGDPRTSKEQQVIERQVQHMMRLVDDLLDVARITRGTLVLKQQRLDLRGVITKAIELASPLLEQRKHHLEIDMPDQPIPVEADDARLTQVFANILVNAARYTEDGGHISIRGRALDGEVCVSIQDDGRGMPPELLARVFDLFVQGQQSPDRSQGGLGIGLTLARRLVEKQGGRVSAESPGVGLGSTFTVHLPISARGADVAEPVSVRMTQQLTSRPQRVLVVDDNEDAAVMLAEVLQSVGHQVETAGDAAEAMRVVRRFQPEVAILDIGLPVMDGYALAVRLREEHGPAAPRMIAVTGYGQQTDRERSLRSGFSAHLVKPVDVQALIELISLDH